MTTHTHGKDCAPRIAELACPACSPFAPTPEGLARLTRIPGCSDCQGAGLRYPMLSRECEDCGGEGYIYRGGWTEGCKSCGGDGKETAIGRDNFREGSGRIPNITTDTLLDALGSLDSHKEVKVTTGWAGGWAVWWFARQLNRNELLAAALCQVTGR